MSSGRLKQQRSPWDTVHPGRTWAVNLPDNTKSEHELRTLVAEFLSGKPVPEISTEDAVINEN